MSVCLSIHQDDLKSFESTQNKNLLSLLVELEYVKFHQSMQLHAVKILKHVPHNSW